MAALRLLSAIGGLALTIAAAACVAPTPTLAPEPTAYERVTEELLPGMQWADLEPGLAWFVRAHVDEGIGNLAASPDDKARILDGLYALGGDEEDRECGEGEAGACGVARLAHHLNGASGRDGWEIGLGEIMIRTRYTNPDPAYRILIHEMGHALTWMGHSYRCGSLMRDWDDEGFIRGCVAAGYPRYHREFSPMDEAVMLINSHPAVAAGTRRADWRDFICGRDC